MITEYSVKQGIASDYLSLVLHNYGIGIVHSSFKSSFNISINNRLVHIDSDKKPLSAFGLNIPEDVLYSVLKEISAGNLIRYKDNSLTIYTNYSMPVKIKFEKLLFKNFKLPDNFNSSRLTLDNPLLKEIAAIDFKKHIGFTYFKEEAEFIEKLSAFPFITDDNALIKTKDMDIHWIEDFTKHFIGLGKGLTPSGDDFIVGFIMMQYIFRKEDFIKWKLVLERQLDRRKTTDVSLGYYRAMLEGYTSEQFYNLVLNLFNKVDSFTARNLIYNILNYGSSSGYDTLFGIYIGLIPNLKLGG